MSRRCEGQTRAGKQCARTCPPGEIYCSWHNEERSAEVEALKLDVVRALRDVFSYGKAADVAGINHTTLKFWRTEDPEFGAACEEARGYALDLIESALVKRAIGWHENGRFIFSDRAAELMLRGERSQYRHGYEQTPTRVVDPVEAQARRVFEDPEAMAEMEDLLSRLDET